MDVQYSGARVVAIHRFLHLLIHADGNVVRVAWHPCRRIRRGLNHEFFLVFRKKRVVKKMHEFLLIGAVIVVVNCGSVAILGSAIGDFVVLFWEMPFWTQCLTAHAVRS